jgi:hypothetical protein
VKNGFTGVASILHNTEWKDSVVSFKDLPAVAEGQSYELVIVDASGATSSVVANLGTGGEKGVMSVMIANTLAKPGSTLAIVATGPAGREVMLSAKFG